MRSLFFVPADRFDLHKKLYRFDADVCVLDLEDGTPQQNKIQAREQLNESIEFLRKEKLSSKLYIRVNSPTSVHYLEDIRSVMKLDVDGIVIPKIETTEALFPITHYLETNNIAIDKFNILLGVESIKGIENLENLFESSAYIKETYFGSEDLIAELGGVRTSSSLELLYSRSKVILAARARGVRAYDQAYIAVKDEEGFSADAMQGKELGYHGKICLTPNQILWTHQLFTPSAEAVEKAKKMIAAYQQALTENKGTVLFENKLLEDGPMLKSAQAILDLAQKINTIGQANGNC